MNGGTHVSPWVKPMMVALTAAALLAVVLAVVVPAQGTSNATIKARVGALEKKSRTYQKDINDLKEVAGALLQCFIVDAQALPIGQGGTGPWAIVTTNQQCANAINQPSALRLLKGDAGNRKLRAMLRSVMKSR